MEDRFLCVMAEFDKDTELKLKELQRILLENGFKGKQTPNLPNHITLGSFDISKEEELKEKVRWISQNIKSFDIMLSNIGLFGLEVLFIAPAVNHELLRLQENFNNNYHDGFGWTAHTTLLIDNNDAIIKVLPIVASNFQGINARIEAISLYEFWPTRFILEERLL